MKLSKTIFGLGIILIIWQIIALLKLFNPIYFASPLDVIIEALNILRNISIYLDIYVTFKRIIISLVISIIIGVPSGILLGYFTNAYESLSGIIDFFRSIPPIVFYPLLLISFGIGDFSRIGVAVIGCTVVIILIVSKRLYQQGKFKKNYFTAMGATHINLLKDVILFESLPNIMTAIRTASSWCIIMIIATEMIIGSKYGLGSRANSVQITSNIPDLFFTIIIIGFIGVILNKLLIWLDKKFVFWEV